MQAADASYQELSPEALNHAFLAFMQQVAAVQHLRPAEVAQRTGVKHQHQRKLKPAPPDQAETHVTLFTVVSWTNGMRLPLRRVVEWLLARLATVLLLLEPLAA